MNNNELKKTTHLIWGILHLIENEDKSKDELLKLIEPVLINLAKDERKIGRNQILNHFKNSIETLTD